MTREELKEQIDELMQQYANEEIDGATYAQRNSMTQIHWGAALPLISQEDLLGCICRLYAPDGDHVFTLVFDDE